MHHRFKGKKRFAVLLFAGMLLAASGASALEIGSAPPDFELPGLSGGTVKLSAYRGRPIVLKLATTWCPSCKTQVKELALARTVIQEHNAALVEVFVDEPAADVLADVQGRSTPLPSVIAIDDGKVARRYSLLGIPRVVLIDREFKVRRDRGLITADELAGQLREMAK